MLHSWFDNCLRSNFILHFFSSHCKWQIAALHFVQLHLRRVCMSRPLDIRLTSLRRCHRRWNGFSEWSRKKRELRLSACHMSTVYTPRRVGEDIFSSQTSVFTVASAFAVCELWFCHLFNSLVLWRCIFNMTTHIARSCITLRKTIFLPSHLTSLLYCIVYKSD